MPTENKTTNLSLNSWLATDKPKREDFVNDNNIIDTVLGTHIADTSLHITEDFVESISNSAVIGTLAGDGESHCVHTLPITPKFVIVFLKSQPPTKYDASNNYTLCNYAIACSGYGNSKGISLSENKLTLNQSTSTPVDKVFINLNLKYGQYVYIAFK